MTAPVTHPAARDEPQGLGGWLIAWAAWAVVAVAALGFAGVIYATFAIGLLEIPQTGGGYISFGPDTHFVIGVLAVVLLVIVALGIAALWLHFRRSRRARLAHCLWLIAMAGFQLYVLASPLGARAPTLPLIIVGVSIVGLVYFLRSRRVRNTFVR